MNQAFEPYTAKALESLAGARSEAVNGRFNNAANRAYFAAYQAAVVALLRAGITRPIWAHDDVQALFAGQLIGRRKLYAGELRGVLSRLSTLRIRGDYEAQGVSSIQAQAAIRDAQTFLNRILGAS